MAVMPSARPTSGWAAQTRAANRGFVSPNTSTIALRTTTIATRTATPAAKSCRAHVTGSPPVLASAFLAFRNHEDLVTLAADFPIAVPVAIGTVAVGAAGRAGLGQRCAQCMGPSRLEAIQRLDRRSGAGLAALDHEQKVAGGGREQGRSGKRGRAG